MTLRRTPAELVAEAEMAGRAEKIGCASAWPRVPLRQVASILNGAPFPSSRFNTQGVGLPLIRIRDVRSSEISTWYDGEWDPKFLVHAGDLLVGMDGDFHAAVWQNEDGLLNQRVCRIDVDDNNYSPAFLFYALQAYLNLIWTATSSTTVKHLSSRTVGDIPLPQPDRPTQERIVDLIEEHLSHLDAADASLAAASARAAGMTKALLMALIPSSGHYPATWDERTVGTAGTVQLGRQRHPDWHRGDNMHPYLRVANVFEDRIDAHDVMEMHWEGDSFEHFRLTAGDILLNEGQSPDLLGRPAIYRGTPADVAFTNSLLRFRVSSDVDPEFALLVFRRHMHSGRFKRESRITTNIGHLSASRLKQVEFPVPPLPEQKEITVQASQYLSAIESTRERGHQVAARSAALRRSVLSAAFSGRLTGHASDGDIIEETAASLPASTPTGAIQEIPL